jgi:pimeloyl-ACP methyl ester carboxylesterase
MPSPAGLLENPSVESIQEFRARAFAKKQEDYPRWVWQAALERIRSSSVRRTRAAMTPEDSLDASLGKLNAPTIVIWGKQDRILPLEASQDFRRLAPESISSFREVDDCGHLPQKECPESVVTAVKDIMRFGTF